MINELARRIAAGPRYFPHSIDLFGERMLLVELDERRIAEASFIDQRLLTPDVRGGWAGLDDVAAAEPVGARDDAQFIFHIGHCGSTLLSRLLDLVPGVLGLREPQSLRDITMIDGLRDRAESPWSPARIDERTALLRRLLARTFHPEQRALVKATSFVSDSAAALVPTGSRAVFLYVSPQSYLETIFAGENSRAALTSLTGPRLLRLHRRIADAPWRLWELCEGERAALAWACEMTALTGAAAGLPSGSVMWLDFDDLLAAPAARLTAVAHHLGYPIKDDAAEEIVQSGVMHRYSKAPEHGYSPVLRRQLQAQARQEHGSMIARGLAWLDAAGKAHPTIATAREQAGEHECSK